MSQATDVQNRTIEAVQKAFPLSRLFRTNTGSAYPLTTFQRALSFLKQGITPPWLRPVQYGIVGGGDVSGWIHHNGVAICCHIEVKVKDSQSDSQRKFEAVLVRCGGIYIVVHSAEEAVEKLKKWCA